MDCGTERSRLMEDALTRVRRVLHRGRSRGPAHDLEPAAVEPRRSPAASGIASPRTAPPTGGVVNRRSTMCEPIKRRRP